MKLGIKPIASGVSLSHGDLAGGLAELAEESACESLWAFEHVVIPGSYRSRYPYAESGRMSLQIDDDVPDPLDWLAYAAARTRRLRLATAIIILPEHNPVILAKRAATIDALSGGRLMLGVGVGWLHEEFDAVGVPFQARGRRTDEYIKAMRELWSPGAASFRGEFTAFDDIHCNPKPVQEGGIPVIIGGSSSAAIRRAAKLGQGFYPLGLGPDALGAAIAQLTAEARRAGRHQSEIEITATAPPTLSEAQRLKAFGVSRLVLSVRCHDLAQTRRQVASYMSDVVGPLE